MNDMKEIVLKLKNRRDKTFVISSELAKRVMSNFNDHRKDKFIGCIFGLDTARCDREVCRSLCCEETFNYIETAAIEDIHIINEIDEDLL